MERNSKNHRKDEKIMHVKENFDDRDIIKKYVLMYPEVLEHIDQELLNDRNFCEELLFINGMSLKYMPEYILKDKELVISALRNSAGFALRYADDSLKSDIEVVKYAILKYAIPLRYASEDLQIFFKEKWEKYYSSHYEREWMGYNIIYNGVRTSKEEMDKIYEGHKKELYKSNNLYKNFNEIYENFKEFLEDKQIDLNEYEFEEREKD